jgi:hypothetical protein
MSEVVHQKGILDANTDPRKDAYVIMTTAVLGYAWWRLSNGHDCSFDFEIKDETLLRPDNKKALEDDADFRLHRSVVSKLNAALQNNGMAPTKQVKVGITPIYRKGSHGNMIIGGSGHEAAGSNERCNPAFPTGTTAEKLFDLAVGNIWVQDPKDQQHKRWALGYQGRGAYTGFVTGRTDGQTGLLSTFRHTVPQSGHGRRWHPTTPIDVPVGPGETQKTWGMIGTKALQDTLKTQGMHMDKESIPLVPGRDIVGYTHGMIQAVYDVRWHEARLGKGKGGRPHEIAVGDATTKLASCFPCTLFMEATGFPPSSTHIGRGESWSPLYPDGSSNSQQVCWSKCNAEWHQFCQTVLEKGLACLRKNKGGKSFVHSDYSGSLAALGAYVEKQAKAPRDFANLILDALTVHEGEAKRVEATLVLL